MALTSGGRTPSRGNRSLRPLHPPLTSFAAETLHVGGGHALYLEQCGQRNEKPVVVLHGGPGGGCSPAMRRFFNPDAWRIILFDQRGCGRSTPHASLEDNTTWDLVDDLERIRTHFGLERWTLFGGSWGSTLALAYAQAHPDRVAGMILRGVFLITRREIDWFYGGGAGALLPRSWSRFLGHLDASERPDPIAAYQRRLTAADRRVRAAAARAWTPWEGAAISRSDAVAPPRGGAPRAVDALARIENHYVANAGFMTTPNQLLDGAGALSGIPGVIVQGRLDLVTPPASAVALADAWPGVQLDLVEDSGHAASEPGIVDGLVRAAEKLAAAAGG